MMMNMRLILLLSLVLGIGGVQVYSSCPKRRRAPRQIWPCAIPITCEYRLE